MISRFKIVYHNQNGENVAYYDNLSKAKQALISIIKDKTTKSAVLQNEPAESEKWQYNNFQQENQ